jgi:hypothetical protein
MPTVTTGDVHGLNSLLVKTAGYGNLRITVMPSVLAVDGKLTPFVLLKRWNLLKEKFSSGVTVFPRLMK